MHENDNRPTSVTTGSGQSDAETTTYTYDLPPGSCPGNVAGATWCTQWTTGTSTGAWTDFYNAAGEVIETLPPGTIQTPTTTVFSASGLPQTVTSGSGKGSTRVTM